MMNIQFDIIDKDTGEILFTGIVTQWSMDIGLYKRQFKFEGVDFPKPIKEKNKVDYFGNPKPEATHYFSKTKECEHRWGNYEGFTEQYSYCELCNIKKK